MNLMIPMNLIIYYFFTGKAKEPPVNLAFPYFILNILYANNKKL
jgi:hypothetical protein